MFHFVIILVPRCCFGLFGPPSQPKNLRIRPWGYFFKLRSILMLPGFKIPLQSKKIKNGLFFKTIFFKNRSFFHFLSVFWSPGASKSNAAWKNTSGVLFWDFLAWWEAHWCPAKVQVRYKVRSGAPRCSPGFPCSPNLDLRWAPMSFPSGQKISE